MAEDKTLQEIICRLKSLSSEIESGEVQRTRMGTGHPCVQIIKINPTYCDAYLQHGVSPSTASAGIEIACPSPRSLCPNATMLSKDIC